MIVRLPQQAAVDVWAVAADGRRLAGAASGVLDVPDGAVLEVRGRRRARAQLAWLTELSIPVVSIDVRRSRVNAYDLMAAASLPSLAVLTAAGDVIDRSVVAAISQAPNLAVLQLTAPALRAGDLLPLRAAGRLRQVRLEVPQVPAAEVVEVLGQRQLVTFGLSEPRMTAGLFDQVATLWPLREMAVAVDYLDRAMLSVVRRLSGLGQLALDARWAHVTALDVTELVCGLPGLRQLELTQAAKPIATELLLGALWLRPGLCVNGLTMTPQATARFIERWAEQ
ncbi:MAG: hypothetical protein GEV07_26880 [Streptosporangiales bacterium]|nr:hypothetical protein [Streptosporangiales bacterium]